MRRFILATIAATMLLTLVPVGPAMAQTAPLRVGIVDTVAAENCRSYINGAPLNGYYDTRVLAMEVLMKNEGFSVGRINDAALSSVTTLKTYDVIVLPRTLAMTAAQRKAFKAYIAEGGGAVASFGMSRWDYNTSYKYDYMPFLGMSNAPGLYTWPPSTDALKPWEWGDVSEIYNVKFKNDPLMYANYQLAPKSASSHWILSQTAKEAGALTLTDKQAQYNEVTYTHSGATNVTPLYTYNTLANTSAGDNSENGYLAGWTSEYYFGRFVYYGFQLHDLTRGGIYADDTTERRAERLMVNSVKWAADSNGYVHVNKQVTLSGAAWLARGKLYIDQTVKNVGGLSTRGPLKIEVRNPAGSKVYVGQAYNNLCPLPPGNSYTHRSYQFPVSPTPGTWTVKMTYQYYNHFANENTTASRIMYLRSTGAAMSVSGYGDHITTGSNLATIGTRVAGATRYDTSVELSKQGWPNGVSQDQAAVILATGSNYPDALAAAPLAGSLDAPVLLVPRTELTTNLRAELKRLYAGKTHANIYVVGGTGAVSNVIVNDAKATLSSIGVGAEVERIAGANRWATAAEIAEQVGVAPSGIFADTAIIVSGQNYPDALAVGALSAAEQVPILLVSKDSVPTCVQEQLKAMGIKHSIILGGTGAVSAGVESWLESHGHRVAGVADNTENVDTRLAGATRYSTGLKALDFSVEMAGLDDGALYFATGGNWPDALALASVAGKQKTPLVLLSGSELGNSADVANYLCGRRNYVPTTYWVGGEGAVSDYVRGQARVALGK